MKKTYNREVKDNKKRNLNRVLNTYIVIGVVLWILAAGLILTPVAPSILYRVFPDASNNEKESLTQNLDQDQETFDDIRAKYIAQEPEEDPLPEFDPDLPKENIIRIEHVGVNSELHGGEDWETALEKGPWIVPGFSTPESDEYGPIIIASHRWGILGWDNQDRREKSFIRLPEVLPGDKIEIIWNQRLYEYEVKTAEENTEITNYDADLILYTCQFYWPSPVRIFRYAERVN
jgi:sortase (surface protein transpeptidase)